MPFRLSDPAVTEAVRSARAAARASEWKDVVVDGVTRHVPTPFPSPIDWRDRWIYFLVLDRFARDGAAPAHTWNQRYDFRQGGTFAGVTSRLGYLQDLGVGALWLSPVLKNPRPDWQYNYHGYGAQNFVELDARFGTDGTLAAAERELTELVEQAHARDIAVILDIVLNHAGRVFDYVRDGRTVEMYRDAASLHGPPGTETSIRWLNGFGFPRVDWHDVDLDGSVLSPDDAVRPDDLRHIRYFRRRGSTIGHDPTSRELIPGDFEQLRQLVFEYDAAAPGPEADRADTRA